MSEQKWGKSGAATLGIALLVAAPALAGTHMEKHLDLASGGSLVVESDIGSVTVRGGAAAGADVVLTADRNDLAERYDLTFEASQGEARILVKRRHGLNLFWHEDDRVHFAISVPRATSTKIRLSGGNIDVADLDGAADLHTSGGNIDTHHTSGNLVARSSGGNVQAHDVRGNVELDSSGGNLVADSIAGALLADTSGGGIDITRVSGDVTAKTSGGHVKVHAAGGRVVAGSSGGSVEVSFAPGNAHGGELESSGGDVRVQVDPAAHLTVDAASSGGSVVCDLPLTVQGRMSAHRIEGAIQGGGNRLRLRSSGGDVSLASLQLR